MFDGKTTVDVDVDVLGKDTIWQEEELEFEDVEEPDEDEVEQAQGRLEELRVQPESKWPARYMGNSERSKRRHRKSRGRQLLGPRS